MDTNLFLSVIRNLLHVQTDIISEESLAAFQERNCYDERLQPLFSAGRLAPLLAQMEDRVIYEYRDVLDICVLFFRLQETGFFVGPFVRRELGRSRMENILMHRGFPASYASAVALYRSAFPMNSATQTRNAVMACIKAFSGEKEEYAYVRLGEGDEPTTLPRADYREELDYSALYQRYDAENRFLRMIETGDTEHVVMGYRAMSMAGLTNKQYVTAIFRDPAIGAAMTRALARKAAENGGAPLVEINEITQRAVQEMAALHTAEEINTRSVKMVVELTESVRRSRLRTGNYSDPIRKTVEFLNLNYTQNIPLTAIAKNAGITHTYLSKIFRQEVGTTMSEYIARLRCEHAAELLRQSNTAVQDISAYVGYLDNNYFVKVFRKQYGMTPTEYRKRKDVRSS